MIGTNVMTRARKKWRPGYSRFKHTYIITRQQPTLQTLLLTGIPTDIDGVRPRPCCIPHNNIRGPFCFQLLLQKAHFKYVPFPA